MHTSMDPKLSIDEPIFKLMLWELIKKFQLICMPAHIHYKLKDMLWKLIKKFQLICMHTYMVTKSKICVLTKSINMHACTHT